MIDYEKILRVYIRHVNYEEGTPFLNEWDKLSFVEAGLSEEEADRLVALGEEAFA